MPRRDVRGLRVSTGAMRGGAEPMFYRNGHAFRPELVEGEQKFVCATCSKKFDARDRQPCPKPTTSGSAAL